MLLGPAGEMPEHMAIIYLAVALLVVFHIAQETMNQKPEWIAEIRERLMSEQAVATLSGLAYGMALGGVVVGTLVFRYSEQVRQFVYFVF
jgi:hypothetical protein